MSNNRRRAAVAALVGIAGLAAGCAVGGSGIGAIAGVAAVVSAWLLLSAGTTTGCEPTACLSPVADADVCLTPADDAGNRGDESGADDAAGDQRDGPCLTPEAETGSQDADAPGPCLEPMEDVPDSDGGADDAPGPCLEPAEDVPGDADGAPDTGPCLAPPGDKRWSAAGRPPGSTARRLADAGILSADQVRRLARLRGRA